MINLRIIKVAENYEPQNYEHSSTNKIIETGVPLAMMAGAGLTGAGLYGAKKLITGGAKLVGRAGTGVKNLVTKAHTLPTPSVASLATPTVTRQVNTKALGKANTLAKSRTVAKREVAPTSAATPAAPPPQSAPQPTAAPKATPASSSNAPVMKVQELQRQQSAPAQQSLTTPKVTPQAATPTAPTQATPPVKQQPVADTGSPIMQRARARIDEINKGLVAQGHPPMDESTFRAEDFLNFSRQPVKQQPLSATKVTAQMPATQPVPVPTNKATVISEAPRPGEIPIPPANLRGTLQLPLAPQKGTAVLPNMPALPRSTKAPTSFPPAPPGAHVQPNAPVTTAPPVQQVAATPAAQVLQPVQASTPNAKVIKVQELQRQLSTPQVTPQKPVATTPAPVQAQPVQQNVMANQAASAAQSMQSAGATPGVFPAAHAQTALQINPQPPKVGLPKNNLLDPNVAANIIGKSTNERRHEIYRALREQGMRPREALPIVKKSEVRVGVTQGLYDQFIKQSSINMLYKYAILSKIKALLSARKGVPLPAATPAMPQVENQLDRLRHIVDRSKANPFGVKAPVNVVPPKAGVTVPVEHTGYVHSNLGTPAEQVLRERRGMPVMSPAEVQASDAVRASLGKQIGAWNDPKVLRPGEFQSMPASGGALGTSNVNYPRANLPPSTPRTPIIPREGTPYGATGTMPTGSPVSNVAYAPTMQAPIASTPAPQIAAPSATAQVRSGNVTAPSNSPQQSWGSFQPASAQRVPAQGQGMATNPGLSTRQLQQVKVSAPMKAPGIPQLSAPAVKPPKITASAPQLPPQASPVQLTPPTTQIPPAPTAPQTNQLTGNTASITPPRSPLAAKVAAKLAAFYGGGYGLVNPTDTTVASEPVPPAALLGSEPNPLNYEDSQLSYPKVEELLNTARQMNAPRNIVPKPDPSTYTNMLLHNIFLQQVSPEQQHTGVAQPGQQDVQGQQPIQPMDNTNQQPVQQQVSQ